MLASEAILPPRQLLPAVPHGVTVSLTLHALIVAGALLLGAGPPDDAVSLESIAVSVISIETASEATSPTRSDAAQTLVAAGAMVPLVAETATPPAVWLNPVEPDFATPPVETVEPSAAVQVAPTLPLEPAEAVAAPAAVNVAEAVPELVVEVAAPAPDMVTAAIAPVAEAEQPTTQDGPPIEAAQSVEAQPVETRPVAAQSVEARPVEPEVVQKAVEPPPAPARVKPRPAPVEKVVPPTQRAPAERERRQPVSSGSGGQHEANAMAAAGARGGAGRRDAGGSGAISRYPGFVEARLKRALRFPRGADRSVGRVRVNFTVNAGGDASAIQVSASSGSAILDAAAVETVRRAAPFPPIPGDAGRSSWSFTMPLTFRR